MNTVLSVILTGGKSSRMGHDKALLDMEGGAMSLVLAQRYAGLGPVAFAVDRPGRFDCGGFLELADEFPGCGPFNGIYSAFLKTQEDYIFLTATDMPNGDPALVRRLREEIGDCSACTILRKNGFMEPLFSIYHRSCFNFARECMETGRNSLLEVFRRLNVRTVPEEELAQWDMEYVLCNINTPKAYRQYRTSCRPAASNRRQTIHDN